MRSRAAEQISFEQFRVEQFIEAADSQISFEQFRVEQFIEAAASS